MARRFREVVSDDDVRVGRQSTAAKVEVIEHVRNIIRSGRRKVVEEIALEVGRAFENNKSGSFA